jgi:glucosyl-dolichyl phosphate glucuronosyltransferase
MRVATVIVCTHNRADLLDECVRAIAAQRTDAVELEIVVVDNASSDGTAAEIGRLQREVPNLRTVFEPAVGLSRARNRGIATATGEFLLFVDDDARPDPGWLDHVVAAYGDDGAVGAVGGRVRLDYVGRRPQWVTATVEERYSAFDKGSEPRRLTGSQLPYGANMSVRRDLAVALGGFSTDLGRVGSSLLSNEEQEFFRRLVAQGHAIAYEPRAVVRHLVPTERTTLRWVLRRAWAQGRSDVRVLRARQARPPRWWGVGVVVDRATARRWRRLLRSLPRGPHRSGLLLDEAMLLAQAIGACAEWRRGAPPAGRRRRRSEHRHPVP